MILRNSEMDLKMEVKSFHVTFASRFNGPCSVDIAAQGSGGQ